MSSTESPVYSFLERPSMVDFTGRLALVVFVSGCNFRCGFCHNAALMAVKQRGVTWSRLAEVCDKMSANWVNGVVITGGEPTMSEGILELIEFFRKYGWSVKLDTNGSNPGVVRECLSAVDYVAMDVKAGLSCYGELTGFLEPDKISASIDLIKAEASDHEFRTTVIESFHTDTQMHEIGSMIRGCARYALQPFVPRDNLPDPAYRVMKRTSPDRMTEVAEIMKPYAGEVLVRGE